MAVGALALLSLATSFSSANFAITSNLDLATYDMILGLSDSFFWFLVPLFSAIAVGVCVLVNYAGLILTHSFSAGLQMISQVSGEHGRRDFQ